MFAIVICLVLFMCMDSNVVSNECNEWVGSSPSLEPCVSDILIFYIPNYNKYNIWRSYLRTCKRDNSGHLQ